MLLSVTSKRVGAASPEPPPPAACSRRRCSGSRSGAGLMKPSCCSRCMICWISCSSCCCASSPAFSPEQPLHHLVGQHAAAHDRLEDRVVERLHRALVLRSGEIRIVEPARQQQVGQLRHQRLEVEVVEVATGRICVYLNRMAPGSRLQLQARRASGVGSGGGMTARWSPEPGSPEPHPSSVVVPLLPPGICGMSSKLGSDCGALAARGRGLGGVIAAVVAAADLLGRVEPFEDERHRRCACGRRGLPIHAGSARRDRAGRAPAGRPRAGAPTGRCRRAAARRRDRTTRRPTARRRSRSSR